MAETQSWGLEKFKTKNLLITRFWGESERERYIIKIGKLRYIEIKSRFLLFLFIKKLTARPRRMYRAIMLINYKTTLYKYPKDIPNHKKEIP